MGWGISLKTLKIKIRYSTQLFTSYVLLIIAILIPIIFATVSYGRQYVENMYVKKLTTELLYIENIINYSRQPSAIESVFKSILDLNEYDLRLTVMSNNGFVIYDSKKDPTKLDNHANRPEFIKALGGDIGAEVRYSKSIEKNMLYVAKLSSDGSVNRLSIPMFFLEAELTKIRNQIIQFILIILTFCILFTVFMSAWLSRSLDWILNTIKLIKNKDFDQIMATPSIINEFNQVNDRLYDVSKDIQDSLKRVSKEKEKKEIVLNNMINGLVVTNNESEIKLMNQAAYSLFFNSLDKSSKIDLNNYPEILEYSKRLLNDHSIEPVEVKHSNGKVVLITGSVYLEGKRPQGILIAQDITKLKQLETTRQQFVANVSHELKTPITYIRSLIETILNAKEKNIDLDINFIEKALGHTDRLNNIINDLLQLSKLEFGEVDKESLNIAAAIDAAIQENQPRADKKNIVLVYKGADIDVPYNYSLMIQAIKNLIENAIKFSSEETKVVIDCKASDFAVDIEVSDFGQGIPAEHIPNLFQRFYRVDTARSRQLGGTGLGLSIVKHIAQSHGGEAFVTSEIDKGSTFTIRLPLN